MRGGKIDELKYQTEPELKDAAGSGELLTLKLRYKAPDAAKEAGTSRLLEFAVMDEGKDFEAADADLRFAASVAGWGMLLRGSTHAGEADYASIVKWARAAVADAQGLTPAEAERRAEFIQLVERAGVLATPPGE